MTDKETQANQSHTPSDLLDTIRNAECSDTLIKANSQTPLLLAKLITSGEKTQNIKRLTAQISDSILVKFITKNFKQKLSYDFLGRIG